MINVNLSQEDWENIIPEKQRTKKSKKEFWYAKRNMIISRIENIDLEEVTEKELLQANLTMLAKIYWELRKEKENE